MVMRGPMVLYQILNFKWLSKLLTNPDKKTGTTRHLTPFASQSAIKFQTLSKMHYSDSPQLHVNLTQPGLRGL